MSRINAIRFINLNYNYNSMKIDDECFKLDGQSTLMSLRNGGGKSVIVQMVMAPFINKRYRDLGDRPFESYFTSNKPTFILIEWKLDDINKYVLTGMMVRKRQELGDDIQREPLEIINFIHEYQESNEFDIINIPFVTQTDKGKKLINFGEAKSLLEKLKKESKYKFSYYDMTQSNQARRYFVQLEENNIYYKEWESIVRKINLKESGLSELFQKAKTADGLVEEWFLKIIEDKINIGDKKRGQLSDNASKYINQYKSNQSKIILKQNIELFGEEVKELLNIAGEFSQELKEAKEIENTIANLIKALGIKLEELDSSHDSLKIDIEEINIIIDNLKYEKLCMEIYALIDKNEIIAENRKNIIDKIEENDRDISKLEHSIAAYTCAKIHEEYMDNSNEVQKYENDLE